jgi:hypothetical protein
MRRYTVSTEGRMLDVVEWLMVQRGVVIVAPDEMFGTLIIETKSGPLRRNQRSTISAIMKKFQAVGWVRQGRGGITITDPTALRGLV